MEGVERDRRERGKWRGGRGNGGSRARKEGERQMEGGEGGGGSWREGGELK